RDEAPDRSRDRAALGDAPEGGRVLDRMASTHLGDTIAVEHGPTGEHRERDAAEEVRVLGRLARKTQRALGREGKARRLLVALRPLELAETEVDDLHRVAAPLADSHDHAGQRERAVGQTEALATRERAGDLPQDAQRARRLERTAREALTERDAAGQLRLGHDPAVGE